jgi:hypothetical protein
MITACKKYLNNSLKMWSLYMKKYTSVDKKFSGRLYFTNLSSFSTSVEGDIDKHRDKERKKKERQEREFQLNNRAKANLFRLVSRGVEVKTVITHICFLTGRSTYRFLISSRLAIS